MRRILILSALAMSLAACEAPVSPKGESGDGAPTAAGGVFSSALESDVSGYYLPADDMGVNGWAFHHLFLGQAADFEVWEAGQRSATFAPIMIEFEDRNSPMVQTELGESRSGRDRVLPTSYSVTGDRVRFEGRSEKLGVIRFDGRLDAGGLAEAKRNLGDETPVLTGTLSVGDRMNFGVRLRWWAGD